MGEGQIRSPISKDSVSDFMHSGSKDDAKDATICISDFLAK